jgi:hypothetical protein
MKVEKTLIRKRMIEIIYADLRRLCKKERQNYLCNRPWRPVGL